MVFDEHFVGKGLMKDSCPKVGGGTSSKRPRLSSCVFIFLRGDRGQMDDLLFDIVFDIIGCYAILCCIIYVMLCILSWKYSVLALMSFDLNFLNFMASSHHSGRHEGRSSWLSCSISVLMQDFIQCEKNQ